MTRFLLVALPLALPVAAALATTDSGQHPNLIVHEWGTFTAIAGADGQEEPWTPLAGRTDLPCFVHRTQSIPGKDSLVTRVRMETPVIYFYAPKPEQVDVRIGFREGLVTEYYPNATVAGARGLWPGSESTIDWRGVALTPGSAPYPVEKQPNHYYEARDVDAATVSAAGERDRFLFYRGVGGFRLPLRAIPGGDAVRVENAGPDALGFVMLFENRGGRTGFTIARALSGADTLQRPALTAPATQARLALEDALIEQGLYAREAAAMVATWDDTWFEDGSRLFYIVPRGRIDEILPLRVSPAPASTVRVFVGRLELVTDETFAEVRRALLTGSDADIDRFGRFLLPFSARVLTRTQQPDERGIMGRRRDAAIARLIAAGRTDCASTTAPVSESRR